VSSAVRSGSILLSAAGWPTESSLPALREPVDLHGEVVAGSGVPAAIRDRIGYGRTRGIFPYRLQTRYDRERSPRELPVVVIENEILSATFAPTAGGRLWSLEERQTGRELLASNRWFQPANLALRNAWIAGGVEWNIGTTGHSPLTLETLHTALLDGPDGSPLLRMYEWERLRGLVFQIDVWLPPTSPWLHVYVRIQNPSEDTVPAYWWSNVAVEESSDTRVLAPADADFRFAYEGRLERLPFPGELEDRSFPGRTHAAADHFFDVLEPHRPWIAAVDGRGRGLVQVSTPQLRGRKLFNWGRSQAGRRWQEWLSHPGGSYLEVQAGLTATQMEHLPLGPGQEVDWVELYGPVDLGEVVQDDWGVARRAMTERLDEELPETLLAETLTTMRATAGSPPSELLLVGSGWGALEEVRRGAAGEPPLDGGGTPMPASALGHPQSAWIELLETGQLPARTPADAPEAYVSGGDWERRLLAAPPTWETWLHLGHLRFDADDLHEAELAYRRSFDLLSNAWALHGAAMVSLERHEPARAADLLERAWGFRTDHRDLAVAALDAHLQAAAPKRALRLIDALEPALRADGRIRALEARAAIGSGDLERARDIVEHGLVVPDLREGEALLDRLWADLWTAVVAAEEGRAPVDALREIAARRYPLPQAFDFRLVPEPATDVAPRTAAPFA
jgi:hypothetical protein